MDEGSLLIFFSNLRCFRQDSIEILIWVGVNVLAQVCPNFFKTPRGSPEVKLVLVIAKFGD